MNLSIFYLSYLIYISGVHAVIHYILLNHCLFIIQMVMVVHYIIILIKVYYIYLLTGILLLWKCIHVAGIYKTQYILT